MWNGRQPAPARSIAVIARDAGLCRVQRERGVYKGNIFPRHVASAKERPYAVRLAASFDEILVVQADRRGIRAAPVDLALATVLDLRPNVGVVCERSLNQRTNLILPKGWIAVH